MGERVDVTGLELDDANRENYPGEMADVARTCGGAVGEADGV